MTVKQTVEITNKLGMHARPAMKLFELMQGFDAEVLLRNDEGTEAEANSVIALLMLDSAKGRQIEIEATGRKKLKRWRRLSLCSIPALTKTKPPPLFHISPTPSRYLMTANPKPGMLRLPIVPQSHPFVRFVHFVRFTYA
ncbi:phosphocarrier protein Hpr [Salmonella enterica subsp. arizonae]|nr:phosphocarrier protein Hpr [Salmonella enterica subsp. arizonae]